MDPEQKANSQFEYDTITIGSGVSGSKPYEYNSSIGSVGFDFDPVFTMSQNLASANSGTGANIIGGGIGQNHIYTTTTTGTGDLNWNINSAPTTISAGGQMDLRGDRADIRINGRSMSDWMAKVEERLNILTPNPALEKEWDELRRLGERYRKLEKKCKEKSEMWRQLKKVPPPPPPRA